MALVLIGFMGAGKSSFAAELACKRATDRLDSDALLEARFGHSIAREFELHGEQAFREAEEELVCRLLADAKPRDVIALGGGSVLSNRVRDALGGHATVLLDIDEACAWERVGSADGSGPRPLARDRAAFGALYAERRALYERTADAVLLWARCASASYPVLVGRGLLEDGRLDAMWPFDRDVSRPFCVSDTTVASLYAPLADSFHRTIELPPGESSKTLASAELVWSALAEAEMTRADHLVALGGGVVGDLAGFVAATYQRGVPVVHVPTTLVAQVDSAYGGKTGVDLPQAKNYVGAYHQPAGVIVDPDALATLPAGELAAGWAEVVKTALIAGGELWARIATDDPLDERTILGCARTKLQVVAEDERDAGRRQALNLGHTVAHAIETVTGYARYRHGEAVGFGLLAALRLSGRDELREQVRSILSAHGLPVTLDAGIDVEQLIVATRRDKKRTGAHVPFVLLADPGEVRIGCEVAEEDLRGAVQELCVS